MGIFVENVELENGIITDLYYTMPYYKANARGFQCVCRVYSSFDNRKNEKGVVYPKKYVDIENPPEINTTKMNPKEMYDYVYSLLTKKLGGKAELDYSTAQLMLNQARLVHKGNENEES